MHLLHEEVVHAPVVIGTCEYLQGIVLPLDGLESRTADLHTAPALDFRGRLFVLFKLPL